MGRCRAFSEQVKYLVFTPLALLFVFCELNAHIAIRMLLSGRSWWGLYGGLHSVALQQVLQR